MYNVAPLVKGNHLTGFTNGEEEAVHLTKVVPFLVEDELKGVGGRRSVSSQAPPAESGVVFQELTWFTSGRRVAIRGNVAN